MLDIDGEYVVVQAVAIAGAKTPPLPSPLGIGRYGRLSVASLKKFKVLFDVQHPTSMYYLQR